MSLVSTLRYRQRNLPHWEVNGACYFVTVRCVDSLPAATVVHLRELREELSRCAAAAPQTADLKRKIFRVSDTKLDAGFGDCPLGRPVAAQIVVEELMALAEWQISVPHYSIMPNHWHALLVPAENSGRSLSDTMKRLKGRTAKRIRQVIDGTGPFWQGEWFDRWVRNVEEWNRIAAYIQNNPVKAGLVERGVSHPWTK